MTRLPPPEQWVLHRTNEMEVAELIEQHIDYVDEGGCSVHLPTKFVRHYVSRDDGVLPTAVAIATLPIVLGDGSLLAPDGLDRATRHRLQDPEGAASRSPAARPLHRGGRARGNAVPVR
jgi:hypothetical protein